MDRVFSLESCMCRTLSVSDDNMIKPVGMSMIVIHIEWSYPTGGLRDLRQRHLVYGLLSAI